jgi:hypothetical protein
MTIHNALAAPAQTGSKATARINLTHFGTAQAFKIQAANARNKGGARKNDVDIFCFCMTK